jgi:V/A-type H+-transporting ATPase subunit I
MAVCAMQKLTAAALRSDADYLIRRLMWLSCVEVIPVKTETDRLPDAVSSFESECADAERDLKKLGSAINLLKNYVSKDKKSGLFSRRPEINRERYDAGRSEYSAEFGAAQRAEEITHRISEIANKKINLLGSVSALQPWKDCPVPLDLTATKETCVWFGTLPLNVTAEAASAAIQSASEQPVPCAVEQINEDAQNRYVVIIYHISCEDIVYSALSSAVFVNLDLHGYTGTAAENLRIIESEIIKSDNERCALENELSVIAASIGSIKIAYDAAAARLSVLTAKKKLYETSETVILSGWVPRKAAGKVTGQLEKMCCCWELSEPQEGDSVPVLLQNRQPASAFEMVIGLYSLPAYGSFDPTVIMSVFYFIIFGLMLGDVVYGFLLAAGGVFALKFLDFDSGIKKIIRLFAICGISCIISGILFGSYLGDLPVVFMDKILGIKIESPALLFDPVTEPILYLFIALAAGVLHLVAGMIIKFFILWRSGDRLGAIFDVGSWFILFTGIGVYTVIPDAGKYIAVSGVLIIILTQGRAEKNIFMKFIKGLGSLYGIINYASDLLSYSRIMALGMASAVIASVVNILATLVGTSIIGFPIMIIIILIGHAINLSINCLVPSCTQAGFSILNFSASFMKKAAEYLSLYVSKRNIHMLYNKYKIWRKLKWNP